eukprot:475845-Prymnesium_polylepis.1
MLTLQLMNRTFAIQPQGRTQTVLARRGPEIFAQGFRRLKAYTNKHVAQLNAGAKQRAHQEHAVTATKSPQDCGFVSDLLSIVTDADA